MQIERPNASHNRGAHLRVLVVEDDEEMRELLCEVLGARGYGTLAAANDAQALIMMLRETPIDAVLLDKNLPGLSGLDILPGIRRMYHDMPVILISAFGDADTAGQARQQGATAYLPKPFRMADVLRILAREGEVAALRRRLEGLDARAHMEPRLRRLDAEASLTSMRSSA